MLASLKRSSLGTYRKAGSLNFNYLTEKRRIGTQGTEVSSLKSRGREILVLYRFSIPPQPLAPHRLFTVHSCHLENRPWWRYGGFHFGNWNRQKPPSSLMLCGREGKPNASESESGKPNSDKNGYRTAEWPLVIPVIKAWLIYSLG